MHKIVSHLQTCFGKMREIERVVRSCGIHTITERSFLADGSLIIKNSVAGRTFSIEWSLEIGSVNADDVDDLEDLETEWGNVSIPQLEFELWYLDQEDLLNLSFDCEDGLWMYINQGYGILEGSKLNKTFEPLSTQFPDGEMQEKNALDFISMITAWFWKNKNESY